MSARFDDALVQEVRDRSNIVQVVGDYVSLKKAGHHLKGLCPFHNERTPSFTVHEGRQFFYCFGCQTGGDVITFVRELHGYSFVEAVRHLADRAGLALPEPRSEAAGASAPSAPRTSRGQKETLFAAGRDAAAWFTAQLHGLIGVRCRSYLRDRGLDRETVERFGLGYAPAAWDGLVRHLQSKQIPSRVAIDAGLVGQKRSGQGHYDRFRDRLMFPIRNLGGEVIAFGGRTLPDSADTDAAKYINSPDTPVYDKSRNLFGLYEARRAVRAAGAAVIVEGNVDVLRVSQAGLQNVVAPMGTALTPEQCRLAHRFAERVVLVYDGDRAGRAATLKAIPAALAEGLQVGVVTLPMGDDPDTFVSRDGADALRALVDAAKPGWQHLVETTIDNLRVRQDPLAGTPRALDELAPVLDAVPDRRERALYEQHLARELGLEPNTVTDFLRDARTRRRSPARPSSPESPVATRERQPPPPDAEWGLCGLMLIEPTVRPLYWARDAGRLITSRVVAEALERLANASEEELGVDPASFVASLDDPSLRDVLFRALAEPETETPAAARFESIISELRRGDLDRRKHELARRLEAAIRAHDEELQLQIVTEKKKLVREIETLKGLRGSRWPS